MANFLVRLWVHDAEDGLLPEVAVTAETKFHAAALALRHFVSCARPLGLDSYLQCEPCDGEGLRVCDVLDWLNSRGVHFLCLLDEDRHPVFMSASLTDGTGRRALPQALAQARTHAHADMRP